ncbi:MAG: MFS transporter [Sphingomonadales bacterium]|nr:MFS transporter [Sphingomonadales bacterium]NCP01640.1 MFS transporter [Sphingomonadales bacterium]NCQ09942.1 MFS transporter [Sphingomonadales bacterium]PIX66646.1 MAG: MFS transporter [Sphingomonadales bacterium CG_4_10_14_3_um_filter_58_15]
MQMNSTEPLETNAPARISELKLFLFALSSAAVVANGYYIHPLITPVAEEFGVSGATIGLAPALNQIALALGILLLLPLGDRINNRKLVTIFVAGQFFAMLAMALSGSFALFVAASSLLGFVTIAPYLLPAYVTRRVAPGRIGHVTGIMTAGVTLGILGSRVGGGLLGHYFGWRSAYWVGVASMALLVILLPLIMERKRDEKPSDIEPPRYGELLRSLWPIMKSLPEVPLGGLIQALSFGLFLALWLAIGLHLPRTGYGVDTVGYLAIIAIVNVLGSPLAGRFADRVGAERARVYFSLTQLVGVCLLPFADDNLWLLVVAVILNSIGGASVDICSRTILFSRAPDIRTRLMTIYIVIMFIGGGISSWLGAATYEYAGWPGISVMAIAYALAIMGLSLWGLRFRQARA